MVKKVLLILFILILGLFVLKYRNSPKIVEINQKIEYASETIAPKPTIILESGLPNRHLINTTFVPQAPEKNWDQPWQDACEEAAMLTVHYYYQNATPNFVADLNTIFNKETELGFGHDVNQAQMSQTALNLWGYESAIINNPSVEDIKKYISQDVPVIVTGNGKTLYKENKRFKNGGPWYHALVILGYDDNSQKFIVHDVGTQFGAYFKYSYDLLIDSIHDFPASLHKEDIDSGVKQVLILIK